MPRAKSSSRGTLFCHRYSVRTWILALSLGSVSALASLGAAAEPPSQAAPSEADLLFGGGVVETQANVFTRSTQGHGALAALPNGGFVTVWDSKRQEHGDYAVVAQRFDAFGRPVGGEVPVNVFTQVAWSGWKRSGCCGAPFRSSTRIR